MKTCTKCKIEKPLLDFYSHPKTQDGKQSSCKKCCIKTQKPYTKIHHQKQPKPPKKIKNQKPHKIKKSKYTKHIGETNLEYMKLWKENHPEYMKEYMKIWRKNNPKYIQNYTKKRKNIDP